MNLAFGTRAELLDLARLVAAAAGVPLVQHIDARADGVRHVQSDATRLWVLFPGVQPVPLVDALATTVDWVHSERSAR